MLNKNPSNESGVKELKNESAKKRWEMFHKAIACAKESTNNALLKSDAPKKDVKRSGFHSLVSKLGG
jgi:hypothetical protein